MSEVSPEIKQRTASQPNASVWVNASAGSGKTTVLTNRVIRLLLDDVRPEAILCLTFTRAAAAEMSIRITSKLSHWATCDDNELSKDISDLQGTAPDKKQMTAARRLFARVLACPSGMRIRTLHAFCQEVLRRFPIEAGLPPHFTVIEENDVRLLQTASQNELLQKVALQPENLLYKGLKRLVCDLGERGFGDAMRSILSERGRLHSSLEEAGGLPKLILRLREELSLKPSDTVESITRQNIDDAAFSCNDLKKAAAALTKGGEKCQKRGHEILKWLALSPGDRVALFEDYFEIFFTTKGEYYKNYADKKTVALLPDAEKILSEEAARLESLRARLEAATLSENTTAVLTIGQALIEGYEARKKAQAVLDYDDLIIKTDELLRRPGIAPWILYKLDGGLDHILVDEAQDTSRAQWSIVQVLADEFFSGVSARSEKNRTLFVVGDEKQSIFSFQRADPEAFIAMRQYFSEKITEAKKKYTEVPMRISFRSAPAILNAVDAVFSQPPVYTGVSTEPVKHYAAPRRQGDPEKLGRVEVWPLHVPLKKEESDEASWALPLGYEKEHDPQAELAREIAKKISRWLKTGRVLPGAGRLISAGDIMILLRRRGRFADLMVRALKECEVPVTGVDRMRLIKQLPVMDLLALIQFVLLPEDDLNLATVLRGPMLGLSEDQLMKLAMEREGSLWESLSDLASSHKEFKLVYSYLERWFGLADFITPLDLLARILNEPCPGSQVSGRSALWSRLGPDALDPIDELLNAAQNFSRRHTPSLQGFLHWLTATEAEIKRELDRGGGQVRIMTVHASKGLEAPIVFLPDTTSVPRIQDMPKFLWDKSETPFYVSRKPMIRAVNDLWNKARQKQMEEYRRLLYVALTRAANEVYIGGWEPNRKDPNSHESWYGLIRQSLEPLHSPASLEASHADISFADLEMKLTSFAAQKKEQPHSITRLPAWAKEHAKEELSREKTLAPSRLLKTMAAATPDQAFKRGRIIHRLLESLPNIIEAKRESVAMRFLSNPQHNLKTEHQTEIKEQVLRLLLEPAYAGLFGPGSQAEVPLIGRSGGRAISGQIDRLYITEREAWIVDYKTNRPPPSEVSEVPEAYRLQLQEYRDVLSQIYPDKTIRSFLLWTYQPSLMELP